MGQSSIDLSEWTDPWWRVCHLYTIVTDDGAAVAFRPNREQEALYKWLWFRNLVPKARQLGITTFAGVLGLDQCVFNANTTAAIIAHSLDDAGRIFRNKVQRVYDALPEAVKQACPLAKATASELVFGNGSSISVSTSVRSGTVQFLHVSEMGKIVRKYPERAREIVTGSFEAVPKDGIIIVESTTEGSEGWFADALVEAKRRQDEKAKLTRLDWRLHFFPWYNKASYRLAEHVSLDDQETAYFDKLERAGIPLDREQRSWYAVKKRTLGPDMLREYPSTLEESLARSLDGAFLGEQMTRLRELGRIGKVPTRPEYPVNTFWDFGIGVSDYTAVWMHQRVGGMDRFVRYMQDNGEGLREWWERIEKWRTEKGCRWGKHYLPHDADTRMQGYELETRRDILQDLGMREVQVVARVQDLRDGIALMRRALDSVEIDAEDCTLGIKALDNYSREWNESAGAWSSRPRHDQYSHGADAFRQFAQGYRPDSGPRPVVGATSGDYSGGY